MRARPTIYKGVKMRSRTEARFAAEIDGLCFKWEYEPVAFADERGQYLPDFRITWEAASDWVTWVEIKPTREQAVSAMRPMSIILSTYPDADLDIYIPSGDWPNVTFERAYSYRRHHNGQEWVRGWVAG